MKDLNNKKMLTTFFRRFHLVLFITLIVGVLSVAIILLSGVASKASGTDAEPTGTTSSNFDQTTIDRIKQLKTTEEPSTPLDFSNGRINPFHE